jgi:eukaryotic-like serine/threonine-protein kinase
MKNSKRLMAIITTAVFVLLVSSFAAVSKSEIVNLNPNYGAVNTYAPYLGEANSAATAAAKYGNLLNEDYAWINYLGNTKYRTGFNPGPAPDRPDILWASNDVWAPLGMTPLNSAVVAFSGKLMQPVTVTLTNGTAVPALAAFDPFTGANIWYTPLPAGQTFNTFSGSNHMHKVDDNHLIVLLGVGAAMFRVSDGALLWIDNTINPGASYHRAIVDQDYKIMIGPVSVANANNDGFGQSMNTCWDLSNPEVNKGNGGRVKWANLLVTGGNTQMAYGDGMLYEGSFVSCTVWAVNVTTGEMVWQTKRQDAAGYAGAYSDGKLIVACQSKQVMCYDGATGKLLWTNDAGVGNRAFNVWNVIIGYGRVYVHDLGFDITGATRCLDLETGKELWKARTDMSIAYYQMALADGKLYARQSDNSGTTGRTITPVKFCCWDAFTGTEIWSINNAMAWPTIAYGCLYGNVGGTTTCYSTAVQPKDWSMWRGNVEQPGVADTYGPFDLTIGPKWTFTTGGPVTSSPAVVNGKLYINSGDRYVYCLDAYNGKLNWKFLTNAPTMMDFASSPAVVNGKVFIGPDDGTMYCLDANDGHVIWSKSMGTYTPIQISTQFNTRASPIVYNNRVFISSPFTNTTYCLDLNGNTIWSIKTKTPVFGSIAIEANIVYFLESAGSTNIVSASEGYVGTLHKVTMDGTELLSTPIRCDFSSGTYDTPLPSWQTPVVVGDRIWIGVNNRYAMCYNATNGAAIYYTLQPNILAERSHGSPTYVPDSYLTPISTVTTILINGTMTYNRTSYATTGGKVFSNAGPTMACFRADNGAQIWNAWGGWEVFSSPVFAGRGNSALLYSGSESYGLTCWNASDGTPVSWFTTRGGLTGSPALYDGKLYQGSQDNLVYCFEDHPTQPMTVSVSLDKTQVDGASEAVTATATLTAVTDPNMQLTDWWTRGAYAGSPPLPNAEVIFTFTKPDATDVNVTATTDKNGVAAVSYTPNAAGEWKVIAWYNGQIKPRVSYDYAFSEQVAIQAGTTPATATPTPTPATATPTPATATPTPATASPTATPAPTDNTMTYALVVVAIVVIVVIAAAYMLMKRKK